MEGVITQDQNVLECGIRSKIKRNDKRNDRVREQTNLATVYDKPFSNSRPYQDIGELNLGEVVNNSLRLCVFGVGLVLDALRRCRIPA